MAKSKSKFPQFYQDDNSIYVLLTPELGRRHFIDGRNTKWGPYVWTWREVTKELTGPFEQISKKKALKILPADCNWKTLGFNFRF